MKVKIKLLDGNCKPYRAYGTDSGMDLKARIDDEVVIKPQNYITIPTGIAIELPTYYEGQIRPRSSLSKNGIWVAYGTIDNGYRGEIKVVLFNFNDFNYKIEPYQRIAQLVIARVNIPEIFYVDELEPSERDQNGFGSTGEK